MSVKFKTSFALTVALMIFGCVLMPPLAVAQGSPAEKAAAEKAAAEKAAAEKAAAEKAAAEKAAAAKAEKRAAEKAEIEKTPLLVNGVDPYVDPEDKGEIGNPNRLGKAAMGDRISVAVPGLSRAAEYGVIDPTKLVLFVDGRAFKDLYPESVGWDCVVYKLERTTAAIDAWNGLLGSPKLDSIKPVVVSVGYADQQPWKLTATYHEKPNLNLIVYSKTWAWVSLIGLVLMVLLFLKYGKKDWFRDSAPANPPAGKQKPYSLAKVQVAWWFFLVFGCFLLIYLITGELTMTEQALILIGIGTGTALGSAMIDASKRGGADTELETLQPERARLEAETRLLGTEVGALEKAITVNQATIAANPGATDAEKASLKTDQESLKAKTIELAEKSEKLNAVSAKIETATAGLSRPTSEGLWNDLVTDASGPSFHRFQMIVWTLVLGFLFLVGVYKDLAMPKFSDTMLALMGISAGTYLGFKIPERQSQGEPANPQNNQKSDPSKPDEAKPV